MHFLRAIISALDNLYPRKGGTRGLTAWSSIGHVTIFGRFLFENRCGGAHPALANADAVEGSCHVHGHLVGGIEECNWRTSEKK